MVNTEPCRGNAENVCVSKYNKTSSTELVTCKGGGYRTREVSPPVDDRRPTDELASADPDLAARTGKNMKENGRRVKKMKKEEIYNDESAIMLIYADQKVLKKHKVTVSYQFGTR